MTDKQQPPTAPERIWIDPQDSTFWNDTGDVKNLIEYARVHPVDEGRVGEIARLMKRLMMTRLGVMTNCGLSAEMYEALSDDLCEHLDIAALPKGLDYLQGRAGYDELAAANPEFVFPQLSSSERRCVKCKHDASKIKDGICVQPVLRQEPGTGYDFCDCKCEFPASAPNYARAISLLRALRETTDPDEVARQTESWAALESDLRGTATGAGEGDELM